MFRVRKEIKIRPGFTPQEDVKRFRGTRQAQMDVSALPKGHIVGWTPPTANDTITIKPAQSQSARKNAKRKEKRKEKKDDELKKKIAENWDDDEEDEDRADATSVPKTNGQTKSQKSEAHGRDAASTEAGADALADEVEKLKVQ
jgi:partner of Y14 and mago